MFIETQIVTEEAHAIGNGDLILNCDDNYTETQITVKDIATGTAIITVLPPNGTQYEAVSGGTLDLSVSASITISNYRVGKVKINMSPDVDYSAEVVRY
jgi:hypothetical protein